jgi:hypothetical protein
VYWIGAQVPVGVVAAVAEAPGRGEQTATPSFPSRRDMMPDYPLFLALIENWRPLVLVGLAGDEGLINENARLTAK